MGEVPSEIMAQALGHEALTGAARTKLASMRQYGLLEGRGDKLRLTDRAFRILHSPDEKDVVEALAEAAYAPPLFAEIHSSKPDASDEAIEYWLRRERKFSPEGAATARKAYRETTAAIDLASMSYNKGDADPEKPDPEHGKTPKPKPPGGAQKPAGGGHSLTGLLLEGGTVADLTFSGQPLTREGIDMLVDYLKLTRRAVPPTAPAAAPEPRGPEEQARLAEMEVEDQ
jgi:hypothetical protein